MSSLSNILLDKEILLESGTNELELLVFDVADYTFGINVAKVREVLPIQTITNLPRAHPSVRGVFKLRNQVIPCVSLLDHLGITPTSENSESTMILADFNQQQTAFLVDTVERIHRLSWENILSVPGLSALSHTPVTALARCDSRLIVMLDFEMILDDVTQQYFRTDEVENPLGLPRDELRIVLAEDSPTVREAIGTTLRASGYTDLLMFDNGAEAWAWLEAQVAGKKSIEDITDLVISDVEMPQVDGFHLTKRIKQHPLLGQLPVLLYSSIVTPDNHKKGKAVGADAQVSKPELNRVVQLADELISTAQRQGRAEAIRRLAEEAEAMADSVQETPHRVNPNKPVSSADPAPPRRSNLNPNQLPEVDPPQGVAPTLWQVFHDELRGHTDRLERLLDQAASGDRGEAVVHGLLRTLHTIKSAASVVPLEPITHCTHLVESLIDSVRHTPDAWPEEPLMRYCQWLRLILSPPQDVETALAAARSVEEALGALTPP
ncbi:MAG: chemotaxis protein CheW [Pirellulales bacterium]|nr:chemotaxis protein CheW [Pirellulales bacterium]